VSSNGDVQSTAGVVLPPLPYAYDALKPHLGEETLRIHHDKHHAKYVATTNSMVAGTIMEGKSVEEVIQYAHNSKLQTLFNNAAQSYNHEFYWKCMKPNGGGLPPPELAALIDTSFGGFQEFRAAFATAGNTLFGSGWVWLVVENGKLSIVPTSNAGCPLTSPGVVPILTMDVWEHAYYLHYTNMRPHYVDAFLDHLVNWDFVASQLSMAIA